MSLLLIVLVLAAPILGLLALELGVRLWRGGQRSVHRQTSRHRYTSQENAAPPVYEPPWPSRADGTSDDLQNTEAERSQSARHEPEDRDPTQSRQKDPAP